MKLLIVEDSKRIAERSCLAPSIPLVAACAKAFFDKVAA